MHPSHHAGTAPDKPAIIEAESGRVISYGELEVGSNRFAHFARSLGLKAGDRIAFLLGNSATLFELTWGAQRAGLIFVMIPNRSTADEVDYMLADSGAGLLVAEAAYAATVARLKHDLPLFSLGGAMAGARPIEPLLADQPQTPIADEEAGSDMLYSSGTTGRPKGVRLPPPEDKAIDGPNVLTMIASGVFGFDGKTVYLSPAPLYHAAPLRFSMAVLRLGGTVVVMKTFDAEGALAAIARYQCTAAQFVPTHFVRLLRLPEAVRAVHDLSSLKVAIHAAAPCPVPVKAAMIDWWGPVVWEYYAGSEGAGMTVITSAEWLARPGSVGRVVGEAKVHICDEAGEPVGPRTEGGVFFEGQNLFSYHNDPDKTQSARNHHGWATLGDVGWMDEDGYLYLTDRKSYMIISGGVNIYPQEIENHLITHPRVADAAVIGAPHEEMGEQVVAVIQPVDMAEAGPALVEELITWCRQGLSPIKQPRRVDFMAQLPRADNGKLYKRLLRDQYWAPAMPSASPPPALDKV